MNNNTLRLMNQLVTKERSQFNFSELTFKEIYFMCNSLIDHSKSNLQLRMFGTKYYIYIFHKIGFHCKKHKCFEVT